MTKEEIREADLERLFGIYSNAARQHGEATEQGDYRTANRTAKELASIYAELKERGPEAQVRLLALLFDPAPGICLWAASHALEFAPAEGSAALQRLVSLDGFVGLSAETTLKEWRAGRLRFP